MRFRKTSETITIRNEELENTIMWPYTEDEVDFINGK